MLTRLLRDSAFSHVPYKSNNSFNKSARIHYRWYHLPATWSFDWFASVRNDWKEYNSLQAERVLSTVTPHHPSNFFPWFQYSIQRVKRALRCTSRTQANLSVNASLSAVKSPSASPLSTRTSSDSCDILDGDKRKTLYPIILDPLKFMSDWSWILFQCDKDEHLWFTPRYPLNTTTRQAMCV